MRAVVRMAIKEYRSVFRDCHPERKRGILVLTCSTDQWRRKQTPRSLASLGMTGPRILALRCYWRPRSFGNCARHSCDSCPLRRCLPRSSGRLSRRSRNQSQRLAHFRIQLGHGVFVVFEELAGVFAALADAFAFVAEPRAGFFEEVVIDGDIEQVAFAGDAFAVENVEFGFAEGRGNFVFYYFYAGARASDYVAFFDGGDAANVDADGGIKLQCAAARGGFGIAEHYADF